MLHCNHNQFLDYLLFDNSKFICYNKLVEISTSRERCIMQDRFETFTVLIAKISRNIRKIKNQEMAEYNLKSPHISCIYYLYSEGALNATELCDRCEEDKATISRSLAYLEKNGYLICEAGSAKRYKTPLMLTELGERVGKSISDKISRILCETSKELSDAERTEFYRCLSIISENLDNIGKHLDAK